jgi:hypothetical protein
MLRKNTIPNGCPPKALLAFLVCSKNTRETVRDTTFKFMHILNDHQKPLFPPFKLGTPIYFTFLFHPSSLFESRKKKPIHFQ